MVGGAWAPVPLKPGAGESETGLGALFFWSGEAVAALTGLDAGSSESGGSWAGLG